MPTIDTRLGHVSRGEDGRVSIVRSDPTHGTFLHIGLTDEEVGAILRLLPIPPAEGTEKQ